MKDNSLQNIENYKKDDSVVFYDEMDVYMKYVNVINQYLLFFYYVYFINSQSINILINIFNSTLFRPSNLIYLKKLRESVCRVKCLLSPKNKIET